MNHPDAGFCANDLIGPVGEGILAWISNMSYIDNRGSYHLRPERPTPTHRPKGPIAPWNKALKKRFPTYDAFAAAVTVAKEHLIQEQETLP